MTRPVQPPETLGPSADAEGLHRRIPRMATPPVEVPLTAETARLLLPGDVIEHERGLIGMMHSVSDTHIRMSREGVSFLTADRHQGFTFVSRPVQPPETLGPSADAEGWINVKFVPMLPRGAVELRREGDSLFYRSLTNEARPVQSDAPKSPATTELSKNLGELKSDAPAEQGDAPHPTAKLVAYEDAHAVALELGYPSLTEALEHLAALQAADHIPDAGKMVAAPADPVSGEREAVKQAIHDWVREDAPINQKMTWTPALNTALENRILATLAPSPSVEKLVEALDLADKALIPMASCHPSWPSDDAIAGAFTSKAARRAFEAREALAQAKGSV